MLRHPLGAGLALARAQRARQVDDGVARDPVAQRVEQLRRQRAGAGAELPEFGGAGGVERLRQLAGDGATEQRRQLRRSDEVAARAGQQAELAVAAAVVAQAGRVQGQRHEALEAEPAATLADLGGDEGGQRVCDGAGYTGGRGRRGVHLPIVGNSSLYHVHHPRHPDPDPDRPALRRQPRHARAREDRRRSRSRSMPS